MYANASVEITMEEKHNDLTEIIAHALNEMKREMGEKFNPDKVNLAELERRAGISRAKLRKIKKSGFISAFTCISNNLFIKFYFRFSFNK